MVKIKSKRQLHKWKDLKQNKPNLKLHMVGSLQSNKAKKAVNYLIIFIL